MAARTGTTSSRSARVRPDRPERGAARRARREPGARLVAVVHAETSTGVSTRSRSSAPCCAAARHAAVRRLRHLARRAPLEFDDWGFDYAYSCTQKALAAPPGMSPLAISARARAHRPRARRRAVHVRPRCCATTGSSGRSLPPHRADPPHLRAARGAAARSRRASRRFRRHEDAGALPPGAGPATAASSCSRDPPARPAHRRARPRRRRREGRPAAAARGARRRGRRRARSRTPPIWRLGLMGHNARRRPTRCSERSTRSSRASAFRWPASAAPSRRRPCRCWRRSGRRRAPRTLPRVLAWNRQRDDPERLRLSPWRSSRTCLRGLEVDLLLRGRDRLVLGDPDLRFCWQLARRRTRQKDEPRRRWPARSQRAIERPARGSRRWR